MNTFTIVACLAQNNMYTMLESDKVQVKSRVVEPFEICCIDCRRCNRYMWHECFSSSCCGIHYIMMLVDADIMLISQLDYCNTNGCNGDDEAAGSWYPTPEKAVMTSAVDVRTI